MLKQIQELLEYREVLITLIIRDLKVRYKQTVISVVWAILQPVFMMIIFTVLFNRFTNISSEGVPYFIFCLTALIQWTFFSNCMNMAITSLIDNETLITKIYFPRIVLPLSAICTMMVDFSIASLLYFLIVFYTGIKMTPLMLLGIPILVMQLLLTCGLVFFVSALNVFYRDVKYIIPFLLQVGMFATPIVYSVDMISAERKFIYMLNPMAGIIDGYRKIFLLGTMPNYQYTIVAFFVSLVIFFIGYIYFKFVEKHFADVI